MSRRVFDTAFKKMAVELSYARGSVKEAGAELGIDPGRITKWRHQQQGSGEKTITALTEEQKEIRRLQKALKGGAVRVRYLKINIQRLRCGITYTTQIFGLIAKLGGLSASSALLMALGKSFLKSGPERFMFFPVEEHLMNELVILY